MRAEAKHTSMPKHMTAQEHRPAGLLRGLRAYVEINSDTVELRPCTGRAREYERMSAHANKPASACAQSADMLLE